ncbi:MAG: DUF59 domain-containing protein [Candidatus Lindowbacteria bacterium]|nr:DUF59 domain-containing protein [Candidatus Lindowbacteria bacterium]
MTIEEENKSEAETSEDFKSPPTEESRAENSAPELSLKEQIIEALKKVFDPEIPVNIYELGLIYSINLDAGNKCDVTMTLTSPNCPVAESLPIDVKNKVESVAGVTSAVVDVVWEPTWTPDVMSDAAKLELGML